MKSDWSFAKNKTAFETSFGVPSLPTGVWSFKSFNSSSEYWSSILVLITPGDTEFTVILLGASSFANAFVKPINPAFDEEYKTSQDAPTTPHTELIFIIQPFCFSSIKGSAYLHVKNAPFKLVSVIFL